MANRTTRNKVRWQAENAYEDLRKAQMHFVQLAALNDDRSPYILEHLPPIIAALEAVIDVTQQFKEGL